MWRSWHLNVTELLYFLACPLHAFTHFSTKLRYSKLPSHKGKTLHFGYNMANRLKITHKWHILWVQCWSILNMYHCRTIWDTVYWPAWFMGTRLYHYSDVVMGAIASQITSLMIVYSIVYLSADQRKHQSSASLAFVRGIHRWTVNSPYKWPVTREMFPFDDVIILHVSCDLLLRTVPPMYTFVVCILFKTTLIIISLVCGCLFSSSTPDPWCTVADVAFSRPGTITALYYLKRSCLCFVVTIGILTHCPMGDVTVFRNMYF